MFARTFRRLPLEWIITSWPTWVSFSPTPKIEKNIPGANALAYFNPLAIIDEEKKFNKIDTRPSLSASTSCCYSIRCVISAPAPAPASAFALTLAPTPV